MIREGRPNRINDTTAIMNWKTTLLICIGILLLAAGVTYIIFTTEPTAVREGATKETAMLVDVTRAERGTFQPQIQVTGTVVPDQDIVLSPRVQGEIVRRSPNFVPGGFVRKGEMLLQIDPADFENMVKMRQSELDQVMADYRIEMGRQDVARQDYQLLQDTLAGEKKELILRQPQLESVKAQVEAARANLEQARLQLERTTIRAPFNAQIITRNANVGSQVAPGDDLGRLVGLDNYWVQASVPLSQLRWLTFANSNARKGSEVMIRDRTAWQKDEYRTGYLFRLIGSLEDQTRLGRVLIGVPDPLARSNRLEGSQPLMIGAFVETSIQTRELSDVVRLDRDHLRKDQTVWVMDEDNKLRIRRAEIVFQDAEYAYIKEGLQEGEQVVVTNLSTVVDGAPLRVESVQSQPDSLLTSTK